MRENESNFSTSVFLILLLGTILIYPNAPTRHPASINKTGEDIPIAKPNNFVPATRQSLNVAQLFSLAQPAPAEETKNYSDLSIEARAALAEDFLTSEVLFEKNKSDTRPLASLTKIISALVVLDKIGLDEEIEISQKAVETPEPSSLKAGEHFLARDLLSMAMVESSNDAVSALAETAAKKNGIINGLTDSWFLDLMRQKALSFGVDNMIFHNNTGLDISESAPGAYGSAESVIKIARKSIDSPIWQLAAKKEVLSKEGIIHTLKPTNAILGELPNLIGAKTGFTDLAGGNFLVIVEHPFPGGHPIGIVVLGSSEAGRFEDVKKIYEWIKNKNL